MEPLAIEARSWLATSDGKERALAEDGSNRFIGDDLLRIVDRLYSAGAEQVMVEQIVIADDFEDAGRLRIVLPENEQSRTRLFRLHARLLRDFNTPWDSEGDHGQSALTISW